MKQILGTIRAVLGFDWFPGANDGHDHRRRTTQALKLFTKSARMTAFGNAALLLRAYVSLANGLAAEPLFLPGTWGDYVFPRGDDIGSALAGTLYSWLQAQLAIQSLHAIHRKLYRIAQGDN